jgi:hypothetical protein
MGKAYMDNRRLEANSGLFSTIGEPFHGPTSPAMLRSQLPRVIHAPMRKLKCLARY